MTIVMDEEGFSSSITSLSSGSVNFHQQLQTTLIEPSTATIVSNNNNNTNNNNINTSYGSNVSSIVSLNTSSTPNLNMMQTTSISPSTNMTSSSASITTNGTNMSCRSNNNSINSESNGGGAGSHPFVLFLFRPNASNSNPSGAAQQQNGNVLVNGSSVMTGSGEVFEERKIYLDKPCKVGRSVAKLRPEPNNAIFDCKVLSRNHALLWEENSKFYIQDTKSSNGTFLNGNRLGKSNEDSEPFEITSGDIIQFGVDVTENQKKVTHGCITVEIRLFNKYGEELIDKPLKSNKVDVQSQELYQLAMFLQEALFREEALNKKLRTLQAFIEQAKENSENSWLTLIQEDRLMTRIDYLEKQNLSIKMAAAAAAAANNNNSDNNQTTAIVNSLRDEKLKIETAAKETVEKIIVEKNALAQQLDDLRVLYSNLTEEHTQMCKMNEDNREKILGLADQNQELATKLDESEMSLAELKKKQAETMTALEADKAIADKLVQELNDKIASLNAQIEMSSNEKELLAKQVQLLAEQIELERKTANINGEIDEEHHKNTKSIDENSFHLYNNTNKNDNHVDEYNKNDFLRNVSVPVKEEKYQRAAAAAAALNTSNHDSSSSAQRHLSEELNDSLEMSSSSHNNNNKINNNIKSPSNASNHKEELLLNGPTSPNRTHETLEMALERIDELEHELNEKTRLVNELLLSKDEILNAKYKEIVAGVGITNNNYMCKYCKNSNNNNNNNNTGSKLDSLAQSLSFNNDLSHSESFNTSVSVDVVVDNNNDISIHLEALQNKIQHFFENLNNKNNESNNQDEENKQTTSGDSNNNNNENNLRDLCKSIDELRTSLKQMATKTTTTTTTKSEQQKRTTTKSNKSKNDKTGGVDLSTSGGDDSSYLDGAAAASGGVSSSFSSSLSRDNDDDEDEDEKSAAAVAISTRQGLSSSTYDIDDDDADEQSRTEKTTTTFKRVVGGAGESANKNKISRGGATTRSGEQDTTSVSELEHDIAEKESLIKELRDGYDDLSLRARIVSYFSMIPLIFLLVAIIIAFYPTLSTITATGL